MYICEFICSAEADKREEITIDKDGRVDEYENKR